MTTTPTYRAVKVGGRYEFKRQDAQGMTTRSLAGVGGGLLALYGLSRRGVFGTALAAAGAALAYHGITGRSPLPALRQLFSCDPEASTGQTPSSQHDEFRSRQMPKDEVEEASMESFPASDPPAHSRTSSS